jgi:hypothetical protein
MLIGIFIAVAMAMPAGVPPIALPDDIAGMALHQPCQNCPHIQQTDGTSPDKTMPACQQLACMGAAAMLPAPVILPTDVPMRVVRVWTPSVRWTGADPAPDPFPPRPVVLL